MKNMTRRWGLAGGAAALTGGALLAACGGDGPPAPAGGLQKAAGKLALWHASAPTSEAGKALDGLLDGFRQQSPAIEPDRLAAATSTTNNFEKLQISLAGGQAPDVVVQLGDAVPASPRSSRRRPCLSRRRLPRGPSTPPTCACGRCDSVRPGWAAERPTACG